MRPGRKKPTNQADSFLMPTLSVYQTIYILSVKKSYVSNRYNHKGKPNEVDRQGVAKTCFSIKAYNKQVTKSSCDE